LDLPGGDTTNGNKLWLWDCNGADSQSWLFDADSWRIVYKQDPSKCIDIPDGDVTDGQYLQLWDCNGHSNQLWGYDDTQKTIYAAWPGNVKCIDVNWGDGSGYNTKLQLWDCNGHTNQWWYVMMTIQSTQNNTNQTSTYSVLV
jgi:endo-alpha-N-acetylgalactosaminidase